MSKENDRSVNDMADILEREIQQGHIRSEEKLADQIKAVQAEHFGFPTNLWAKDIRVNLLARFRDGLPFKVGADAIQGPMPITGRPGRYLKR